jgi:HAE1 family hydrophobic/amphiphilic exporter-1
MSVLAFDFIGFEFVPETDMSEIQLQIETPGGYTLEQTKEKVAEIEKLVFSRVPEVQNALFYSGQNNSFGFVRTSNIAFGRIRLKIPEERERDIFTIITMLQEEINAEIPDADVTVINGGLGALAALAMGGSGFMLEVYGNDTDDVFRTARQVEEILAADENTAKTEMNVSFQQQEIVSDLALDYMGSLGVVPYEAAITSRIIFNGMETGKYREGGESYDILLRSTAAGGRIEEDVLERMVLRSQSGKLISFANFADMHVEPAISAIHHKNKMKSVIVTAYLKQPDVRGTTGRVTKQLRAMGMPAGVNWEIAGATAGMMESFMTLLFSIGISVFLVYTVMVIQFEHFTQPLIIMASVPFTVIGVTAGLLIFGSTLSIVAFMGLIALAGIVVNNAIVLVDYINLIRKRDGKSITDAILEGGSSRLKPILMTTITTILGLLPMALGVGSGAEVYAPLGQTIAGGLVTSTLITLFLVPVLYYIVETRKERIAERKAAEAPVTGGEK